ncbi:Protein-export membrane protein SecG [Candidatus Hartigia pinicola]|nr:Protein-export membrane protein SecG [Candidatus Hartigia pinicola]
MYIVFLVMFLLSAISLITLVMLQQGKSTDAGISLNSAASATLFGSSGSSNVMTRVTGIIAAMFFISSLVLTNMTANKYDPISKWENINELKNVKQLTDVPLTLETSTSDIPS